MLISDYSFSKIERIKSKKEIHRIFKNGLFLDSGNIKVIIIKSNDKKQKVHKFGISVPKKLISLAVNRNKIKRRIKEAYRLNKKIIYQISETKIIPHNLFFIYNSNLKTSFQNIESDIIKLLHEIKLHIEHEN